MAMVEEMLCVGMTNTIVLPKGALVIENESDRPTVSVFKGVGINMVVLPRETLYVLQDSVTIEQLSLQRDNIVAQNQHMV